MKFDDSERTDFENLSEKRRRIVEKAIDCDCGVILSGEFSFDDKERVKVVRYENTYYYLRVAIA